MACLSGPLDDLLCSFGILSCYEERQRQRRVPAQYACSEGRKLRVIDDELCCKAGELFESAAIYLFVPIGGGGAKREAGRCTSNIIFSLLLKGAI